jgi:hypothetical protein
MLIELMDFLNQRDRGSLVSVPSDAGFNLSAPASVRIVAGFVGAAATIVFETAIRSTQLG